jgi:superoxide dismutase
LTAFRGLRTRFLLLRGHRAYIAPRGQQSSAYPLVVLDMYEHSYHLDYGAAAAKYVDAVMQNLDWREVNRRVAGAQRAAAALRG